ncbi:hypothetical protein LSAT2_017105 [Lamellibrachia satsuma]|nr:hypothetical protein LSAT2_017105 [Lamellibrachia satsuma]
METGGVRWTGLDALPDICHFPDSSKLELDDWQGYCQGVTMDTSQVFQADGLPDTWSTTQPCVSVSDSNVMPGLSTLDQLSSFEVFPPPLSDGMNTSEDASTALPDVYEEESSTQWTGDTFSYFYGSEYNPFGCAFHEMCQDTVNENQSPECTTGTVEQSKPSYSEIAKSTLSTKTSEECLVSQSVSMPVGERLPSKSSSRTVRHVPFDPVTINPNSAYGLDSFATPRLVHKDRCVNTGSRCSVDSFVTAQLACKDRCVNAYSQHSVDSFVTPRPVHKDKRVNTAASSYGLDSFDIPLRGSKHRCSASSTRSSSSESCRPRVDSVTKSFNEDHSDVSGFFQPPSINTHCRKTQASDRRQKVDTPTSVSTSVFSMTGDTEMGEKAPNRDMHDDAETFNTAQTITATLNGMRRTAEDSKLSSSRSKAKVSADSNRQSANGDESMHVPNNSKPISSNDGAFRPKSVDRVNNNLRDNSKGKDRARNNNVRNDSKVSDRTHSNSVRDNSKVSDRTHSNKVRNDSKVSDRTHNNSVRDDSKVSDRTHNNSVRDDSKVSDRTRNNSVRDNSKVSDRTHSNKVRNDSKVSDRTHNNSVRDDSKVSDRTRNNSVRDNSKVSDRTRNNNMTDDRKVSDRTHSSRGHGRKKASEGETVVKTKVDYLELLDQLHDVCTRAGQHLWQLLCKSLIIVLCVLLLVIKGLLSLTLNLFVYIVLFYQDWLKQQQRSYTQPTRTRRNSTHLPRSGNIQLPTTGMF